jgi:hypothetical protein
MRHFFQHAAMRTGRRSFLLSTAGAIAGLAASFGRPGISHANGCPKHFLAPLPAPKPILGGPDLPPVIHEFLPGPLGITLPFTGLPLEGLDVEPSTIRDFKGVTALAYHAGTATGSDGKSL